HIRRRVALEGGKVRKPAWSHLADFTLQAQDARPNRRRAFERRDRRHAVSHHQLELAGVVAVREHPGVAAAEDRHTRLERRLEALPLLGDRRWLRLLSSFPTGVLRRRVNDRQGWAKRHSPLDHQLENL